MKNTRAFTLIELLVVVAILGLLATFVMFSFQGSQRAALDTKRQSDIRQYQTALEVYANRNNSLYPSSGTANMSTICTANLNITSCPDDPKAASNGSYRYQSNGAQYIIWAHLEKTNDYFVVCSNGKVGKSATVPAPTNGSCTLP